MAATEEFDTGGWVPPPGEEDIPAGNKGINALLNSMAAERAPPASQQQLAVNNVGIIVSEKISTEIPSAASETLSSAVPPTTPAHAAAQNGAPSAPPQGVVDTDAPPYPDEYSKPAHEKVKTISAFVNLSHGPTPSTTSATSAVGQGYVPSGRGGAEGTDSSAHRKTEAIQQELPRPPPAATPKMTMALENTSVMHAKELAEKSAKAKDEAEEVKKRKKASSKKHQEGEKKDDSDSSEEKRGKKKKQEEKKNDPEQLPEATSAAPAPVAPTPVPAAAPPKRHSEEKGEKAEKEKKHKKDKEKKKEEKKAKEKKHKKDEGKKEKKKHKKDKDKKKHKKKHRHRKDDMSEGEESDGSLDSEEKREEAKGVELHSETESSDSFEEDSVVGNYSGTDASEEEHGRSEYIDPSAKKISSYEKRKEEEFNRKRKEEEKKAKKAKKAKKEEKKEEKKKSKKAKKEREERKEASEAVVVDAKTAAILKKGAAEERKSEVQIPNFPCNSELQPLSPQQASNELDQLIIAIAGYLMEYRHRGAPGDVKGPLYNDCVKLMDVSNTGVCDRKLVSQASIARMYFFGGEPMKDDENFFFMPLASMARVCLDYLVEIETLPKDAASIITKSANPLFAGLETASSDQPDKTEYISLIEASTDRRVSNTLARFVGSAQLSTILNDVIFWLRPINILDNMIIEFAGQKKKAQLNEMGLFSKSFANSHKDYISIIPREFIPWASVRIDEFKKKLLRAPTEASELTKNLVAICKQMKQAA